ncbi:acetyl/propionyl/methylcrotonyl-CoA carboxylase subunit alpha [Nonomuraea sp. SYSU D8015]|uniref:acetyl/propionyl/methylcrotonyl-CoA carboxylase subunit alpha n=1 Tax=Nonomuraea sp. SYSU D8015 TaxID=2593644 RepID=UPI00166092D8|nr:biotin carboxylase N-terminal domain-containing protein [Nonomuraea sp. SYSU D8015]
MHKVLIANRGEIAVRIAHACRDAGLASVAVYAEQDLDALHVRVADEAYALPGQSAAETYLRIDRLIDVAVRAGADAVHPGYGFLAENAAFAQAVIDTGLTWIGPPPSAIRLLGDKVSAREIARAVGAPLVPGTPGPVSSAEEVLAFAREHGLPVAIKAAHGGGGRGMKVARTAEEIPALYESAVREAAAAFGRGECFVERYLDRPRHVETQCLADGQGTVTVVSTRDCTLQRRHQKLVEEAPAPFLSADQTRVLTTASKAILKAAGYAGAGTCEFLVGADGTVTFLEVNTRLQVEHPVTEEVSGIDLVREQLRIAAGGRLDDGDPPARGHSIEFRINAEDPGRGFLPAPGTLTRLRLPTGPGVRVDLGYDEGMTVPQAFDSLVAKVIVTGRDRVEALARARRVLGHCEIEGMPTVLPFHRAVLDDPAFAPADPAEPFTVHTRWIETEFINLIPPYDAEAAHQAPAERDQLTVEVAGRRVSVSLPAGFSAPAAPARQSETRRRRPGRRPMAGGDALVSPMQGTVVRVFVSDGDPIQEGDKVLILEAMKMEQPLTAHKAGVIRGLAAEVGQTVAGGAVLCEIVA